VVHGTLPYAIRGGRGYPISSASTFWATSALGRREAIRDFPQSTTDDKGLKCQQPRPSATGQIIHISSMLGVSGVQ